MPRIQTTCPRCHQPVVAEVQQLFDMNADPTAKQKLLSRAVNVSHCQSCGYEGLIATPIVYHDPNKELLLTFFPPDLGLPVNEQEKQIGPLITQVVNALPAEKRKGYLFQPQTMFTYQTLIDRILEADGITKEMMEAQQKRVSLLQRLITTPASEDRVKIIKDEEAVVDGNLFTILTTLVESAINQGDEKSAQMLADLQKELLENTEIGRELLAQNQEAQKAMKAIQEASKEGLTREKLLDILAEIKSESSLTTVVSLTRSGMDYQFFQALTDRIEKESAEAKQVFTDLREKLLKITREYDLQMKKQMENSEKILNSILEEADLEAAISKHLPELDEFFSQALRSEFDRANQAGDLARIEKIQKISSILEKMSAPPPEIELIQKLLDAPDEALQRQVLEENAALVTDELLQAMNSIINEGQARQQNPELVQALESAYKLALRFNMEKKLRG
ncbi:MAG: CpXC domain-containing protein [Anaerolineaceae bacterium]|nr:CpXC domain-containing protein [Anaerolineaceae bacterium]